MSFEIPWLLSGGEEEGNVGGNHSREGEAASLNKEGSES